MSSKDLHSYYKSKILSCSAPCRGSAIPVVYGLPGPELMKLSSLGLVHLAGCLVPQKKASHYCTKCRKYIYSTIKK